MHRSFWLGLMALVFVYGLQPGAVAQDKPAEKSAMAPASGPRAEFLNELKGESDKFVRLAQAIPADKYTWRPGPDVRSVAEVFLHVAAANYNLPHLIGTPPPEGFQAKGFDKSTTDKAKQLDWFGGSKNTERGILLFIMRHMGEHLGQSIAYARMIGVVPPWTEEQQKAAKPKQ